MHEDEGRPTVELGQERIKPRVAHVGPVGVRALEDEPLGAEHVHGVLDLGEGGVEVGQG